MRWLCIVSIMFLFFSCKDEQKRKSGLCLSFDDRSIEAWHSCRPMFMEFDARCTFFVTQFDQLTPDEIEMLHNLKKDGHEIASHGARHELAEFYIKQYGYINYLHNEIHEGISLMDKSNLTPKSFSYPYGSSYWFTDALLLQEFNHIRKVSILEPPQSIETLDAIFYNHDGQRVVSSLSIDNNGSISESEIETALFRAKQNNEVVMLFAHTPVDSIEQYQHVISKDRLRRVLSMAHKMGLQFFTLEQLN